MADDVQFQTAEVATPPSTLVVAADDVGGAKYQRVKLSQGADGSATDVSSAAPLQVTVANTGANATAIKVDGSAVTQPVSHAALTELAAAIDTEVQVDVVGALPAGTNNIGDVDILSIAAGDNNIGNVDIVTVPAPLSTAGNGTAATALRVTIASDSTGVVGLNAGTNAIGKLAANSGVDIGDVDVTSISAGENHLGEVGGKSIVKSVTLTTDTAVYASGDLIADTQQIDGFFRKTDGTGVIQTITIIDEEAQGSAFYLLFHLTSTSMGTENSAPNISDANASAGIQGIVSIATTDWVTVSGTKICTIRNIGLPVKAASGTDDLYISALNGTGTPDWDADSLVVQIGAFLD